MLITFAHFIAQFLQHGDVACFLNALKDSMLDAYYQTRRTRITIFEACAHLDNDVLLVWDPDTIPCATDLLHRESYGEKATAKQTKMKFSHHK
jgi:hypothetical protein